MLRDTAGGEEAYPSHYRFGIIYPLRPCGHLPYILLNKTPRNTTGHGKGGGEYSTKLRRDKTVQSDTFNPLPLLIADEIGGVPEGRGG